MLNAHLIWQQNKPTGVELPLHGQYVTPKRHLFAEHCGVNKVSLCPLLCLFSCCQRPRAYVLGIIIAIPAGANPETVRSTLIQLSSIDDSLKPNPYTSIEAGTEIPRRRLHRR